MAEDYSDRDTERADGTLTVDEDQPGRLKISLPERWRLLRHLGCGGQGDVWLAEDLELGQPVAIKTILGGRGSRGAQRLKREIRTARQVHHVNLVRLFELIEVGDGYAVVMEYMEGGTAADLLRGDGLAIDRAVQIGDQVLAGLAALHEHGIVHRDVKPSNVLIGSDGHARLADFGTVRPLDGPSFLTRTSAHVGTPAYMSPEQLRCEEPAPAADIYSFGVTLFQMLTGSLPFKAQSDFDMAHHHLEREPLLLRSLNPGCPRWLERFVARCLSKNPKHRWPDAGAALAAYRRRAPGLPRPLQRRVLAAVGVLAMAITAGTLTRAMNDRRVLETSTTSGHAVVADNHGRELWRMPVHARSIDVCAGDFLSRRGLEVVLAEPTFPGADNHFDLVVRDRAGTELRRAALRLNISQLFPGVSNSFDLRMDSADIDLDGYDDIVWTANSRSSYPSVLGIWNPERLKNPERLMVNSGHLVQVCAADLGFGHGAGIVAAGFNNPLGFQNVAVVLDPAASPEMAVSPDLLRPDDRPEVLAGVRAYVLLGESVGTPQSVSVRDGGIIVATAGRDFRIDPQTTLGADRGQQLAAFWRELPIRGHDLRINPLNAAKLSQWMQTTIAANGQEYRAAAALFLARAAARGEAPDLAAEILAQAQADGLTMRRIARMHGEYLLISGQLEEGRAQLEASIATSGRALAPIDEIVDLGLLACLTADEALFARVRNLAQSALGSNPETLRRLTVVREFMTGNFDGTHLSIRERDAVLPMAPVLALWGRVEGESCSQEHLAELARFAQVAETRDLAHLAEARHQLLNGRIEAAESTARSALYSLRGQALESWQDTVWRSAAEWVMAKVLLHKGRHQEAEVHLRFAAEKAPGSFYGREAARLLR